MQACVLTIAMMQTGTPRCFALDHMADIVLCNQHRLPLIWPLLIMRVYNMLSSPSSASRSAAVTTLRRTILSLLSTCPGSFGTSAADERARRSGYENEEAEETVGWAQDRVGDADEAVEFRALRVVVVAFGRRDSPADVRLACLDIVHSVLQVGVDDHRDVVQSWCSVLPHKYWLALHVCTCWKSFDPV
jgi:hypothetical protein